jgi:hypothetical protein
MHFVAMHHGADIRTDFAIEAAAPQSAAKPVMPLSFKRAGARYERYGDLRQRPGESGQPIDRSHLAPVPQGHEHPFRALTAESGGHLPDRRSAPRRPRWRAGRAWHWLSARSTRCCRWRPRWKPVPARTQTLGPRCVRPRRPMPPRASRPCRSHRRGGTREACSEALLPRPKRRPRRCARTRLSRRAGRTGIDFLRTSYGSRIKSRIKSGMTVPGCQTRPGCHCGLEPQSMLARRDLHAV